MFFERNHNNNAIYLFLARMGSSTRNSHRYRRDNVRVSAHRSAAATATHIFTDCTTDMRRGDSARLPISTCHHRKTGHHTPDASLRVSGYLAEHAVDRYGKRVTTPPSQ